MPASTLKLTEDLIAHVPVDNFEIVNGPGAVKITEMMESLHQYPNLTVNATVTLKTDASQSEFKRTLKIATIYGVYDGHMSFTAFFANRVVGGFYDMKTRTGWFNLE
jgi:hypothetical protein